MTSALTVEKALATGTLLDSSLGQMTDDELRWATMQLQRHLVRLNEAGSSRAARVVERDLAKISFARRTGRFYLSIDIVEGDPDLACHVLDGTIIIAAGFDRMTQRYRYIAMNRAFDLLPLGTHEIDVPLYDVHADHDPDDGTVTVRFTRAP